MDSINNNSNQSSTNQYCNRGMTYVEIVTLLSQSPCLSIEKTNDIDQKKKNNRIKRDVTAGNIDIHAIQTTINDHRTIINYLINNSINATFVAEAIQSHHSRTAPALTSWRDLVDLLVVIIILATLIYPLLCRAGFTQCDSALSFLFRPILKHLQQRPPRQQSQSLPTVTTGTAQTNRTRPRSPINSVFADGI